MTGASQRGGEAGGARWTWEVRAVNAKGLDVRLRLPQGFDALEIEARRRVSARLTRGTCHATLTVAREAVAPRLRIDEDRLAALVAAVAAIPRPPSIAPASLDGLLALRGIVELSEQGTDPAAQDALAGACLDGLDAALGELVLMREREGASLAAVLGARLDAIAALVRDADASPLRRPEAVRERLAASIAALVGQPGLDPDRLHQEAVLIAARADVREELDRLAAHVAAARELLAAGGPVGRRLDFLAQEFGREASTYCAKVNAAALTAIGLELRIEIEQFREQVQNIE